MPSRSSRQPHPGGGETAPIDPAVVEQAIGWFVRLSSGEADRGEVWACAAWREADPEHERAWRRLEAMEQVLNRGRSVGSSDLVRDTLDRARGPQQSRRRVLKALAGVALLGGGGWLARDHLPWRAADYRTAAGERRAVTLADGSTLLLNTATAIDVAFDTAYRRIVLRSGELRIDTAADPRPFELITADGVLRPLGTRFVARRYPDEAATRLAVLQGTVAIRPHEAAPAPQRVPAGRRTRFDPQTVQPSEPLDETELAWIDGLLIAENRRLDDFLAELTRYRTGWLYCDPRVAGLRLTGAFPLADTDRILKTLEQTLPVRVRYLTPYWVMVSAP